MAGEMPLGNAAFSFSVDTTGFVASMQKAETAAKQSSSAISHTLTGASHNASRGLMQLGYAIDDLQYGFAAIGNNIPQIALGLGAGAGVAGAAAIAAVAVSQLIKHWGELSQLWGDDSANKLPQVKTGIEGLPESIKEVEAAINSLKGVGDHGPDLWEIITGSGLEGQEKLQKLIEMLKEAKQALAEERAIAGTDATHSDEARGVGGAVRNAITSLPGGSDELIGALTANGMSPEAARKAVAGALGGNAADLKDITDITAKLKNPKFTALEHASPEAIARAKEEKQEKAIREEGQDEVDRQKRVKEKRAAIWEKALKVGEQIEEQEAKEEAQEKKRARIEALEDQRKDIMDRVGEQRETLWQASHQAASKIMQGTRAPLDMYQEGAGNNEAAMARRMHELQRDANKKLAEINEQLKKERAVKPR